MSDDDDALTPVELPGSERRQLLSFVRQLHENVERVDSKVELVIGQSSRMAKLLPPPWLLPVTIGAYAVKLGLLAVLVVRGC